MDDAILEQVVVEEQEGEVESEEVEWNILEEEEGVEKVVRVDQKEVKIPAVVEIENGKGKNRWSGAFSRMKKRWRRC